MICFIVYGYFGEPTIIIVGGYRKRTLLVKLISFVKNLFIPKAELWRFYASALWPKAPKKIYWDASSACKAILLILSPIVFFAMFLTTCRDSLFAKLVRQLQMTCPLVRMGPNCRLLIKVKSAGKRFPCLLWLEKCELRSSSPSFSVYHLRQELCTSTSS